MKNSTENGSKERRKGKEARWPRRIPSFLLAMGICAASCQPVPYGASHRFGLAPSAAYALDAALDITSYGPINDLQNGNAGSGEAGLGETGSGGTAANGNAQGQDSGEAIGSALSQSGTDSSGTGNAAAEIANAETISPNTAAENAAMEGNAGNSNDTSNGETSNAAPAGNAGTDVSGALSSSAGETGTGSPANADGSNIGTGTGAAGAASGTALDKSQLAAETGTASANLATLMRDAQTQNIGDLVNSEYAIIYDLDENRIVAEKNADAVIYPASMTKIMTILVCAEHITDLEEKLTITQDILDYIYAQDASNCGFAVGEQIAMRDLLYGIVLPSGADAVLSVCRKVAGSDEAFVALMNQKAQELGLSANAHFANASGLYAADHHVTAKDMAQILNAAMQNPLARQVLMTASYQTAPTNVRSKGYSFSNLFLQRQATQDTGGTTVQAAKTGYISQARSCAASYGTSQSGKHYIVVTGKASSAWQCVYDHAALYRVYSSAF